MRRTGEDEEDGGGWGGQGRMGRMERGWGRWREDGGGWGGLGKVDVDRINESDTFVRCNFHFGTHTRICPQKRNSLASNCSITF